MQKAARALSVLGGLAIALAEDADVDGSFEDGSGSGEPGSGEPSSGVYPSPPPPVATPMMPPPFMPPAAASGLVRRSPPVLPSRAQPSLTSRPNAAHRPPIARAQSTGAVVGMAVGIPVGVILLAICVFCVLKSCGKKEVGGSLASGAASVRPGGPRPQAGPMTDQGQELVVKTSSPAAGI